MRTYSQQYVENHNDSATVLLTVLFYLLVYTWVSYFCTTLLGDYFERHLCVLWCIYKIISNSRQFCKEKVCTILFLFAILLCCGHFERQWMVCSLTIRLLSIDILARYTAFASYWAPASQAILLILVKSRQPSNNIFINQRTLTLAIGETSY